MKHKIIKIYGIDLKIKDKYKNPRKKITTNIDINNYKFIKDINSQTNIEMSSLYDNIIYLVRENPDILERYIKAIEDY